jgi:hypothetical protein
MDAALDLLVSEQREPALDLVKPGGAGRGEVELMARVAGEPGLDGRRLAGGVVVEHEMNFEIGRHGLLNRGEEFAEFDGAVTLVAAADDLTGGDVQGGEQRGRAVTLVIMAAPLDLPGRIGSSGWARSRAWICGTFRRRTTPGHDRPD